VELGVTGAAVSNDKIGVTGSIDDSADVVVGVGGRVKDRSVTV
jgi:hypothetical protein